MYLSYTYHTMLSEFFIIKMNDKLGCSNIQQCVYINLILTPISSTFQDCCVHIIYGKKKSIVYTCT